MFYNENYQKTVQFNIQVHSTSEKNYVLHPQHLCAFGKWSEQLVRERIKKKQSVLP